MGSCLLLWCNVSVAWYLALPLPVAWYQALPLLGAFGADLLIPGACRSGPLISPLCELVTLDFSPRSVELPNWCLAYPA
jgi:hypothetical protein